MNDLPAPAMQPTPLREALRRYAFGAKQEVIHGAIVTFVPKDVADAMRDAALAEIARLTDRIEYLTVDCDQYVFWVRDERCHRADDGVVCPREPHCHDEDRRLSGRTPEHPSGRWTKIKEG